MCSVTSEPHGLKAHGPPAGEARRWAWTEPRGLRTYVSDVHSISTLAGLYWFPGATVTNSHKPGGFEQQKAIRSELWRPEA